MNNVFPGKLCMEVFSLFDDHDNHDDHDDHKMDGNLNI